MRKLKQQQIRLGCHRLESWAVSLVFFFFTFNLTSSYLCESVGLKVKLFFSIRIITPESDIKHFYWSGKHNVLLLVIDLLVINFIQRQITNQSS